MGRLLMMIIKYGFVFFCWICLLEGCTEVNELANNFNLEPLLITSIKSILAGVDSLERHVEKLLIDNVFSFKVLKDQLRLAVHTSNKSSANGNSLLANCLNEVITKCDELTKESAKHVKENFPALFDNLGKIIEKDWFMDVEPRPINTSLLQDKVENGHIFYGDISDFCIGKLIKSPGCVILPQCWEFSVGPGKSLYSITHQLLYFEIGLQFDCFEETQEIKDLMTNICSNIFVESLQLERSGYPKIFRDLFMEQIFLCSMAGFTDFLNKDWIETIISWQYKPLGCWGRKENELQFCLQRKDRFSWHFEAPKEIRKEARRWLSHPRNRCGSQCIGSIRQTPNQSIGKLIANRLIIDRKLKMNKRNSRISLLFETVLRCERNVG